MCSPVPPFVGEHSRIRPPPPPPALLSPLPTPLLQLLTHPSSCPPSGGQMHPVALSAPASLPRPHVDAAASRADLDAFSLCCLTTPACRLTTAPVSCSRQGLPVRGRRRRCGGSGLPPLRPARRPAPFAAPARPLHVSLAPPTPAPTRPPARLDGCACSSMNGHVNSRGAARQVRAHPGRQERAANRGRRRLGRRLQRRRRLFPAGRAAADPPRARARARRPAAAAAADGARAQGSLGGRSDGDDKAAMQLMELTDEQQQVPLSHFFILFIIV